MEWMVLPLKRYAEFTGRSRRMEYWMFALGMTLMYFALIVVALVIGFGAAGVASAGGGNAAVGGMVGLFASMGIVAIIIGLIWLGLLIPTIAVTIRRLHDTNRSGWWLMLYVAPYFLSIVLSLIGVATNSTALTLLAGLTNFVGFACAIVLLVFFCLPGTPGPNRFGPDPLGGLSHLAETFR